MLDQTFAVHSHTVPVPSDQDRHDHTPVAQNGEDDDDGKVHDLAFLTDFTVRFLPAVM